MKMIIESGQKVWILIKVELPVEHLVEWNRGKRERKVYQNKNRNRNDGIMHTKQDKADKLNQWIKQHRAGITEKIWRMCLCNEHSMTIAKYTGILISGRVQLVQTIYTSRKVVDHIRYLYFSFGFLARLRKQIFHCF